MCGVLASDAVVANDQYGQPFVGCQRTGQDAGVLLAKHVAADIQLRQARVVALKPVHEFVPSRDPVGDSGCHSDDVSGRDFYPVGENLASSPTLRRFALCVDVKLSTCWCTDGARSTHQHLTGSRRA